MLRRDALRLGALSVSALAFRRQMSALAAQTPIIDTHIHLFDPTRPGGVPWPEKSDTALYMPALPDRYAALSAPFGVVGAIAIEASPLASDNDWLLGVAAHHPLIVGVVGDLVPGTPDYRRDLDRLHANPIFLGFRYGNLWNRNLAADYSKPGFIDGLKDLSHAGLVFECANPDLKLIRAIFDVSERVPGLRIVIDHLPHAPVPAAAAARTEFRALLQRMAENPGIFVKLSEIPVVANGAVVTDSGYYRAALDTIWDNFGEDRVIFGSDWPNSDHVATFAQTLSIVREYISHKPAAAQEKYFWKNSIAAYQWRKRKPDQPTLRT
jgi:L-fuconolactonase